VASRTTPSTAAATRSRRNRAYRKIVDQEKDFDVEPFADDLASLTIDLLMNDAGYRRPNTNLFPWPAVTGDDDREDRP
jgi:FdhE protein